MKIGVKNRGGANVLPDGILLSDSVRVSVWYIRLYKYWNNDSKHRVAQDSILTIHLVCRQLSRT